MVEGVWMAGSMGVRRKRPEESELVSNIYWHAYTIEGIRGFVESESKSHQQVLVYGEAYGKIQSLNYGERGRLSFAAFDILIDGRYLGYSEFVAACEQWGIPRVKEVARGPYSLEFVREHAKGKTLYAADHIREGVVVRPLAGERFDPKLGRVILKYINDDYLLKKEEGKVTDMEDV
jgi:RNA ligase (TIGR02306 family)